jgi:subtilisin-like proprotein convertase family protein
VVLIVTNTALRPRSVPFDAPIVQTGNGNSAIEPGECNLLRVVVTNRLRGVVSGVRATLTTTNPDVVVTQPFSTYPNVPPFVARTNVTPFQISTRPTLRCGGSIDFVLTLATATNGTFSVPIRMDVGVPGTPVRYDNGNDLAIPDVGSVDSTINVAGITTTLEQVIVSPHLSHTAVGDLDLSLMAPDGTTIDLSSNNGGTGNDYGAGEADADRTTFLDASLSSITAGTAPFAASYRPEQPFSAFRNKSGAAVNGAWRLRINDDAGGTVGTLRAWSLFLAQAVCPPGGGECETCFEPIVGAITGTDPYRYGWFPVDGMASSCVREKICSVEHRDYFRGDVHTFTNTGPDACVQVLCSAACLGGSIFTTAYLQGYDPAALCDRYLGDGGVPIRGVGVPYSFRVPAGAVFVIVVHELVANQGCSEYTLNVTGIDCPPRLEITHPVSPPNRVVLKWSTAASGYNLVSTNSLRSASNAFGPVSLPPFVVNGKYTVTNTISGPARFYELRRP